jgi:hypothetical protein
MGANSQMPLKLEWQPACTVFSYYRDLRETIDMVYRAMKPPKTIVVVAC